MQARQNSRRIAARARKNAASGLATRDKPRKQKRVIGCMLTLLKTNLTIGDWRLE
ncbi:hypothetical protein [Silvimonas iriomotensis]|uniref:Uncharacterized protein n=1 Tax=Silvimonas iriomotensis TaxID=449662 RepID=A0ABQ2P8Q1_9NEIS|nr:hypothetical protein [Silvimonas iriomotensis]GGP20735.1 hypothetical protein GCM10010970_16690 [Silvimonas iriomotensis]